MNWKYGWQLSLVTLSVIGVCEVAGAQAPIRGGARALSSSDGFAKQEMSTIYRESVGVGYSSQSLNSLSLANARAQSLTNVTSASPTVPRVNFQPSGGGAKPFSSYSPAPTTSPYLNLFREDFGGNSDLNYNTLVRPQLQQQAFNQQVQRQGQEMARRMQSMAAQSDFNPQGDKNQLPTGHQTTFGYYGHFHPNKPYRPGKSF